MIHRPSDANVFENVMIDRQSKPKVPIDVMTSDLLLQGYWLIPDQLQFNYVTKTFYKIKVCTFKSIEILRYTYIFLYIFPTILSLKNLGIWLFLIIYVLFGKRDKVSKTLSLIKSKYINIVTDIKNNVF